MRQGASASSRVPRDRAAFGLPRSPLHILLVQNLIDNYFFINEKINISWLVRLHNKGRRARSDCWCRTGYSCGWRWRGWAFQTPPQDKLNFTTQKNAPGPSPAPLIVSSASPAATVRGPQTVSRARYQVADVLAFARRCKEQPPAGHRAPASRSPHLSRQYHDCSERGLPLRTATRARSCPGFGPMMIRWGSPLHSNPRAARTTA